MTHAKVDRTSQLYIYIHIYIYIYRERERERKRLSVCVGVYMCFIISCWCMYLGCNSVKYYNCNLVIYQVVHLIDFLLSRTHSQLCNPRWRFDCVVITENLPRQKKKKKKQNKKKHKKSHAFLITHNDQANQNCFLICSVYVHRPTYICIYIVPMAYLLRSWATATK